MKKIKKTPPAGASDVEAAERRESGNENEKQSQSQPRPFAEEEASGESGREVQGTPRGRGGTPSSSERTLASGYEREREKEKEEITIPRDETHEATKIMTR